MLFIITIFLWFLSFQIVDCYQLTCPQIEPFQLNSDFDWKTFTVNDIFKQFIEKNDLRNDNPTCKKHLIDYFCGLQANKAWAWQMFDASSKLPSGILRGNIMDFGNYDECLDLSRPPHLHEPPRNLITKYCFATMRLPVKFLDQSPLNKIDTSVKANINIGVNLTLAICVPSTCRGEDLSNMIENVTDARFKVYINEKMCSRIYSGKTAQRAWNCVVIVILVVYCTFICISTGFDIYIDDATDRKRFAWFIAFSVYSNGSKLFKINKSNPRNIPSLNGIRSLSIAWIIFSHRYLMTSSFPLINKLDIIEWLLSFEGMIVAGSTVTVDTFLVLSGFLTCLSFFKYLEKNKYRKINWIQFYLHRYTRVTVAFAVIIALHVTLLPEMGSGPMWDTVYDATVSQCHKYWWSALLYIQNYVNPNQICIGHSWYLSVDMQLYCLSPLLLLPLWKYPRFGKFILLLLICAFQILIFLIVFLKRIHVSNINGTPEDTNKWQREYYLPTHMRVTPWLIGVAMGYFIYSMKGVALKPNTKFLFLGWIIAIAIMGSVIFGMHNLIQPDYTYNKVWDSMYLSFSRFSWALAVCWIIFDGVFGQKNPINWFLSWGVWQPLSRISYSMYLIHLSLQTMQYGAAMRVSINYDNFDMFYRFCADLLLTSVFSVILTLIFESPIINIEKLLVERDRGNVHRVTEQQRQNSESSENHIT